MASTKLPLEFDVKNKSHIADLHNALAILKLVDKPSVSTKIEMEPLQNAIKTFKKENDLGTTAILTPATIDCINLAIHDNFIATGKTRVASLHKMLEKINIPVDKIEKSNKKIGVSTRDAIISFQKENNLSQDGKISEVLLTKLEASFIAKKFSAKGQIESLHKDLLSVRRIANLEQRIDENELKNKKVGATTTDFIKIFQAKYKLEVTGNIDRATLDKIQSIVTSRGVREKILRKQNADSLQLVKKQVRLNMTDKNLLHVHQALTHLGFSIAEKENKAHSFGKTTREAVLAFQKSKGLALSGHLDGKTLMLINREIVKLNPAAAEAPKYRIRGSVRNELWERIPNMVLKIYEKTIEGKSVVPLMTKKNMVNGFFDITFEPPKDKNTGQIKENFDILIELCQPQGNNPANDSQPIITKIIRKTTRIQWVNFTLGDDKYQGDSEFSVMMAAIIKALGNIKFEDISDTAANRQVVQLNTQTGISTDEIMRLLISHKIALSINKADLSAEVFYAFLSQNLPAEMPSDLYLPVQQDWNELANLVNKIEQGIGFIAMDMQVTAIEGAIAQNLVPRLVFKRKEYILNGLGNLQNDFVINKPILVGNGTINTLLTGLALNRTTIATTFLQHQGFSEGFWDTLQKDITLDQDQVKTFKVKVELGGITKNFVPLMNDFLADIGEGKPFAATGHIAKLSQIQLENYLVSKGGNIPTGFATIADYAVTLKQRSEAIFPAVALIASLKNSGRNPLQETAKLETFFDTHTDFKIHEDNVDLFLTEKAIQVDDNTKAELKTLVRVQKLTNDTAASTTLIENKLHTSTQLYFMGKDRIAALPKMEVKVANRIFESAKLQYAQVLGKLLHFSPKINAGTPAAISPQTYTKEELKTFLGDIPDLEKLFGNLHYCECQHCQSLYSPSAYFVDLLRFLKTHNAVDISKNVKTILFERRPDLGNIKLNCENTNTPLPYIDLVCEILENTFPSIPTHATFNFQTELTKAELRAMPQNVLEDAYKELAKADFPVSSSFNLWQEETRTYLNFLGIPRHELMEKFRDISVENNKNPNDYSIASEYFEMSEYEKDIISTVKITKADQEIYWGFDAVNDAIWQNPIALNTEVSVQTFMKRSQLSYNEVLELLLVKFVNPDGANTSKIVRPVDSCSTDEQKIDNVTFEKLDLMHRFLRLWRKSGWKMWELDLLVRNTKIGVNKIDETAIINLKLFKQLQQKLSLPVEILLSFYGEINTEQRIRPDNPTVKIPSIYQSLFQNPTITKPIDSYFTLDVNNKIPTGVILGINPTQLPQFSVDYNTIPTILSALSIRQADFDLIVGKTDKKLSLNSLSILLRNAYLAKSMRLPMEDFLVLAKINNIDVFASPQTTLDFLKSQEYIKNSPFSINELDYLLNFNVDSPVAWREEGYNQLLNTLINTLKTAQDEQIPNQIQSFVATSFALQENQVSILMKLKLQPANTKTLLEILSDKAILVANPDQAQQRVVLGLLHKIALLIHKMSIDEKNLQWFIDNSSKVNTLDFANLPTAVLVGTNQYAAWLNFYKFFTFKNKYPEPEIASMRSILDKAILNTSAKGDILSEINKITQWDSATSTNLKDLDTKLKLTNANYIEADTYDRLQKCFEMLKISGVDANTMFGWNDLTNNNTAVQTRLAIKSKYENDEWLTKITPLQDDLREKKRKALVAYFLEYSQRNEEILVAGVPNVLYFKDSNALFKYYLIDVEMSACQLTSRIKQAISSVQFFVQRCFLNLESRFVKVSQSDKDDKSDTNAWSQWKWMKNYRIWEANRKVFFYPENWIEPELRDDKSKFFEELESDILQNEITHDNVENAFLNYLHKVDEVAHIDVCGLYHEQEDLNSQGHYGRDITHVVGRTKSVPHIYYYRQYDNSFATWTAWEKIDLDIAGDHLMPVVYNRKLHLFWLVMQQKPVKVHKMPAAQPSPTAKPQDTPEPAKFWEIQLAWSVQKHNGWSPKKISKEKLLHPWERPQFSYHLKPYYFSKFNQLYVDIYLSTSSEFNDNVFYDQITGERHKLTKNLFNEAFLPWHSSSFIFDGDVTDVKLKNYGGSFNAVQTEFKDDSRDIKLLDLKEYGPRLRLPSGMSIRYNRLANNRNALNSTQFNVLSSAASSNLLANAQNPFEAIATQQDRQFDASQHAFYYQDAKRAFFVKPEFTKLFNSYNQYIGDLKQYRFLPFYHPYTALFIRELNRKGIDGLLSRNIQVNPQNFQPVNSFDFKAIYKPSTSTLVDETAKKDTLDFSIGGSYSIYNWEMFFHAPLMIACKLTQNQRFEEAMRWFHYIFDPTNIEPLPTPQRYWVTKPFFEYNADDYRKQRIENILKNIDNSENQEQLKAWKNNPFKPHLIARYRPVAYQKSVVMKYIDNLIAWGDMLFRRDTIEAINEASLLYMLAYELLGERPIKVPNVEHEDKSFKEIEANLDGFGNANVEAILEDTALPIQIVPSSDGNEPLPKISTDYFCIPNNDFIFKYWDTVEDRLFKIRRCMNIEGIVRQLPLFEPPIDPALLVKAAAAGLDLSSVLNDIAAGTPNYRFRIVVQKAMEFCNEVKMLGDRLLGVIEKKDAEGLSLLRSQHEIQLLRAIKQIREKQIDEAVETIGGLNKVLEMASQKEIYYKGLIDEGTSDWENSAILDMNYSVLKIDGVITDEIIVGFLNAIPTFNVGIAGFGGSPNVGISLGPQLATSIMSGFISANNSRASKAENSAQLSNTQGSYDRRTKEWDFQASLATTEKDQIQFQINAATIRQAIAEKELENQELQIENAETTDEYMKNKYSNVQLYNWMLSQVSTIYFQAYQLAFDMAKKAEKCYQHELGDTSTNFIQPLYWDSLKKGLLSGDKLMHDLHRLEAAYIDNNKRELEIRKHISLAQMFPLQLIQLKETGKCTLSLPEWLFSMDYPGHYFRRIKNVSISIPCIVGPYTSINCTLSLIKTMIRLTATSNYPADETDTVNFRTKTGAITSIATSHAQNDSGMFELNFNDDRYLPFEGLGTTSEWQIELPKENNYFNFESLSDVVLHISYTARNGGEVLAGKARIDLNTNLPKNAARLFSLKHEFPNEWYKFMNSGAAQDLVFNVKTEHYPFFMRGKLNALKLKKAEIWIECNDDTNHNLDAILTVTSGNPTASIPVVQDGIYKNISHAGSIVIDAVNPIGDIHVKINTANVMDKIQDIYLLLQSE